ncbi:MAG: DUF3617 family protein [Nitrospirae bacterium]|nr:DUF3617 family protein [Nitrospirota bacterium]
MKKLAGSILVFTIGVFWFAVASAAPNFQDGLWEFTTTVEMEGLPEGMMKPMKHTSCLNQKNAVPDQQQNKTDCKMSDMKTNGNTVTWTVTCPEAVSKGTITYSGATFSGVTETTVNGKGDKMRTMKSKMQGKRIGPCQ